MSIKKHTPHGVKDFIRSKFFGAYCAKSYAQEGEDLVLRRIFDGQRSGFYVDVGAHHPKRFSNTYFFYKLGWRGINIDAMPGSMRAFNKVRPGDINLEIAISDREETRTYYIFNEPALNGFSEELARQRDGLRNYKIVRTEAIRSSTLANILDCNLQIGQDVDFLSVDVEGLDLAVLRSNDWSKYRPKVVLVEILQRDITKLMADPLTLFLREQGYELFSKLFNTGVFIKA